MEKFIQEARTIVGFEEGIEKGIKENKKEMIRKINDNNISLDLISEMTNLSSDEVRDIIDSKQNEYFRTI